jgi:hypothetical protein
VYFSNVANDRKLQSIYDEMDDYYSKTAYFSGCTKPFFNQLNFGRCLSLHCPFCDAPGDERVSGVDESGEAVVLLMFDCPFFFKMPQKQMNDDDSAIQNYLNDWRQKNGEAWLETIGPVLKNRELRNIERKKNRSSAA